MVTELTCTTYSKSDVSRMPSSDATNTAPTSMGLLLQVLNTVTFKHTGDSLTTSHTDHIDLFVLVEHLIDSDFLLQQVLSELDLSLGGTTIHLDFEDVVFLLTEVKFVELGVHDHTNN